MAFTLYPPPSDKDSKTAFGELHIAELTPEIQVQFTYGINTDFLVSGVSGTASITQASGMAIVSAGASTSRADLSTIDTLRYHAGQGSLLRFTAVFTDGVTGSEQTLGLGHLDEGFFFGFDGASFGILRKQNGASIWTAQTDWNKDKMDGTGRSGMTIDPTMGNVYQIQYQWLGFGAILFSIENEHTGKFVEVHEIEYANNNTSPSIFNPTLPIFCTVINTTNSSNIEMRSSSWAAFIEGVDKELGPRNVSGLTEGGITTERLLLALSSTATYLGQTNRVNIVPDIITMSNEGNRDVVFKLIDDPTYSSPSLVNVDVNNSVAILNPSGTISGGSEIIRFDLSKDSSLLFDLGRLGLSLPPEHSIAITVQSSQSTIASVSIGWTEKF